MSVKMLTDKRGALQGVSIETIVRTAYGQFAKYIDDPAGEAVGVIVTSDGKEQHILDTVLTVHETAS